MDEYLAHFFAAAGLLVANLDGKCTVEEEEAILEKLSMLLIFRESRNISKYNICRFAKCTTLLGQITPFANVDDAVVH